MADLEELAGRVEGLSGPDRRVDCAIFATVHPDKFGDSAAMYARIDWTRNRADWVWLREIGMPAYTASTDAAMTLVREDASWELSIGPSAQNWLPSKIYDAEVSIDRGRARTPASALTAAALRDRARTQGNPNG